LLSRRAGRDDTALLDQHGGGSDHHARRLSAHPRSGVLEPAPRHPSLPQRLHPLLLGDRNLVDSAPAPPGILEAPRQTGAAPLHAPVLEHGLPDRDVHGRDRAPLQRPRVDGAPAPAPPLRSTRGHCLVGDLRGLLPGGGSSAGGAPELTGRAPAVRPDPSTAAGGSTRYAEATLTRQIAMSALAMIRGRCRVPRAGVALGSNSGP